MPPPPPPSSSSSAPPPPPTRRYSVLYYKRSFSSSSSNTSKNRGTTARSDGMLSISPPPSYVVKLTSTADDDGIAGDEEEESDEDECNDDANNSEDDDEVGTGGGVRGSKKQKWTKFKNKRQQNAQKKKLQQLKQSQKQRSTTTIWSGVNADISRRAYSDFQNVTAGMIRDDDTLLLNGQWACEIVCLLDNNSDAGATITSTASSSSLGRRSSGLLNKGSTMMNKQQKSSFKGNSLVGEKNGSAGSSTKLAMPPPPRAPLSSMRANGIQPFRSKKTGLGTGSTLPSMRVTRLGGAPSHASATTSALPAAAAAAVAVAAAGIGGVNTMGAKRQQDTANEKYDQSDTSDGEDGDHDENETNANPSSYKIPPSLLRSASSTVAKRPRTVPPTTLGSTFSSSHFPTSTSISGNIRNDTSTGSNITDFPGAKGERINVPASLRNALRPHQREGIAFLWNCVTGVNEGLKNAFYRADVGSASGSVGGSFDENEDDDEDGDDGKRSSVAMPMSDVVPRGAVLADEMGLGKTLMTIATIFAYHRLHRDRRFIVVCPSSLVSNWSKEFDKWLGKASQPKRIVVRNGAESEGLRNLKSFVPLKPNQSEVLILSYEIFRLHVKVIHKAKQIGILVVDEGHRLKNTSGSQILTALNSIDVEARILITGTPIQNNLSEFYNVANFAVPGILGDLPSFRRLYERPMSQANQKNASTIQRDNGRRQSKALDAVTSQFVLRRTQKDILKSLLPPRFELLLFCRPTERQCQLYQSISQRASKSIGSIGGIEDCNNPLMLLTELRKLCTHPSLLDNTDAAADASLSGKLAVLSNLLDSIRRHNPMDKVVIVSNFTSALAVIETSILRKKGLTFLRLDGSTDNKSRGTLVDTFNNCSVEHSFAFLLSSKAGGCGLNLIGANRLICVDADWNPSTDQQAMARVYRQGQTKPCYIYRMFTTGTVEEVIYQRQLQKGNLAKLANDGGSKKIDKDSSSFTKDELRDCFTLKRGSKCDTKQKLGSKWSDYAGDSTLRSHGCEDEPLLEICEDDALTFVHVVDNDDAPTTTVDGGSSDGEVPSDDDDDLSESESSVSGGDQPSSEEEEFDG